MRKVNRGQFLTEYAILLIVIALCYYMGRKTLFELSQEAFLKKTTQIQHQQSLPGP